MKLKDLVSENENRSGYNKGKPLSFETTDKYVYIYRAQPEKYITFTDGSYVTRSKKFAKEHAVSSANVEEENFHVIAALVKPEYVFNASNPGEFIYSGPEEKGIAIFTAKPGDDFE